MCEARNQMGGQTEHNGQQHLGEKLSILLSPWVNLRLMSATQWKSTLKNRQGICQNQPETWWLLTAGGCCCFDIVGASRGVWDASLGCGDRVHWGQRAGNPALASTHGSFWPNAQTSESMQTTSDFCWLMWAGLDKSCVTGSRSSSSLVIFGVK